MKAFRTSETFLNEIQTNIFCIFSVISAVEQLLCLYSNRNIKNDLAVVLKLKSTVWFIRLLFAMD